MNRFLVLCLLAALFRTGPAAAHDVPADVHVHILLQPDGQKLRIIARAPLNAMRDVEWPLRDQTFLDLGREQSALRTAAVTWIARGLELYEGATRLPVPEVVAVRASLESEKSLETFPQAEAHILGPALPPDTQVPWNQVMLDTILETPIANPAAEFAVHPAYGTLGLRVVTALRLVTPSGAVRAFEFEEDPGLVHLDPRWHQAAWRFVRLGFEHILDGTDHLLFLAALVIPIRRLRSLIWIATAFTAAHSVTLAASALGWAPDSLWFPPVIETLIAASIVYMALENIAVPVHATRRLATAFGFGLVHGFGFSFALKQTLQFAGSHLALSLAAFNLGVELGQLLVLAVLVAALGLLFRYGLAERMGVILLSALVAHTGWHWMVDRAADAAKFQAALSAADWLRAALYTSLGAALIWLVRLSAARWIPK